MGEPDSCNRFYAKRHERQQASEGLAVAQKELLRQAGAHGSCISGLQAQWSAPAANGTLALIADAIADKVFWTQVDLGCAALAAAEAGMFTEIYFTYYFPGSQFQAQVRKEKECFARFCSQ